MLERRPGWTIDSGWSSSNRWLKTRINELLGHRCRTSGSSSGTSGVEERRRTVCLTKNSENVWNKNLKVIFLFFYREQWKNKYAHVLLMNIHFNFYLQCIKKILEVSCLDIGVTSFTINFHLVQLVLGQVSKKNYRNIAEIKKKERERTTSYPRMLILQGDQWKRKIQTDESWFIPILFLCQAKLEQIGRQPDKFQ